MELLILLVIVFFIGKAFGGKNKKNNDWPDEPVEYVPPKKKKGCLARFVSVIFKLFVTFIFFIFIVSFLDDNTEPVPITTEPVPPAVVSNVIEETVASTADPTAIPTPASTAPPTTREAWVLRAAQEVYRDDLISVKWQEVDNQKDMIVIWCTFSDNFTNEMRRTGFMADAKSMFKRIAELGKNGMIDYGSCYIVGRTTYLDQYNNEFEGNAMEIRLLEEDLSKLNWDNYMNNDTIINLATTYAVHPIFRD